LIRCHGPATRHNELEAQWKKDQKSVKKEELMAVRHRITLTVAEAKKTLCYRCHDLDNDPNFSSETFSEYWDQIAHPDRD